MRNRTFCCLVFLACFGSLTVTAQDKCVLTPDKVPAAAELHGFRLGMSMEEVKARVPPVVFGRIDPFGISKTSINPSFDSRFDQASFAGVRTVSFTFLDGRLMELWIGYDATFKWQKFDEFVAGISKSLNVPSTWQVKGRGRQISCEELQISAALVAGSPSLRLADTSAEQTLLSRRETAANVEEDPEAEAEPATPQLVGDKKNKRFYPPGCPGVEEVGIANRVIFKDIEEAKKAGYKPAKSCQ
jgi:hypothetical protein